MKIPKLGLDKVLGPVEPVKNMAKSCGKAENDGQLQISEMAKSLRNMSETTQTERQKTIDKIADKILKGEYQADPRAIARKLLGLRDSEQ